MQKADKLIIEQQSLFKELILCNDHLQRLVFRGHLPVSYL